MNSDNPKNTLGLFLRQAQTFIAFTYVLMVGTGMFFYQQKFSEFGINIFQYADILYFLIAPFEDSLILTLCALLVTVMIGSIFLERVVSKKYPTAYSAMNFGLNKKPWFRTYQMIFYPLAILLLFAFYADTYGTKSKKEILASEPITVKFSDGDTITAKIIGKTQTVIFLLEGYEVKAIQLESVKEIGIKKLSHEDVTARKPAKPATTP